MPAYLIRLITKGETEPAPNEPRVGGCVVDAASEEAARAAAIAAIDAIAGEGFHDAKWDHLGELEITDIDETPRFFRR